MDKVTKFNYRKYYKEYYGIDFGSEMEVHHLDENRDNNHIYNLLLIPKDVHNDIHNIELQNSICKFTDYYKNGLSFVGIKYTDFIDKSMRYVRSIQECYKWFDLKKSGYREIKDERVFKKSV